MYMYAAAPVSISAQFVSFCCVQGLYCVYKISEQRLIFLFWTFEQWPNIARKHKQLAALVQPSNRNHRTGWHENRRAKTKELLWCSSKNTAGRELRLMIKLFQCSTDFNKRFRHLCSFRWEKRSNTRQRTIFVIPLPSVAMLALQFALLFTSIWIWMMNKWRNSIGVKSFICSCFCLHLLWYDERLLNALQQQNTIDCERIGVFVFIPANQRSLWRISQCYCCRLQFASAPWQWTRIRIPPLFANSLQFIFYSSTWFQNQITVIESVRWQRNVMKTCCYSPSVDILRGNNKTMWKFQHCGEKEKKLWHLSIW